MNTELKFEYQDTKYNPEIFDEKILFFDVKFT